MMASWGLLTVLLGVLTRSGSRICSPTSYYKNCWIRRYPGFFIDIQESERRGAELLRRYREESALQCSRSCCLTRNFSCNLAIFHYDTGQDTVNCFHLHCPSLESCILSHRGNAVLYNVSKGVDPDLLVFGKYFTSNVRVLPHHYSRANVSEPLPSDKRHFVHPPPPPPPAPPLTSAPTTEPPAAPRLASTSPPTTRRTSTPTSTPTSTWFSTSPSRKTTPSPTSSSVTSSPSVTETPVGQTTPEKPTPLGVQIDHGRKTSTTDSPTSTFVTPSSTETETSIGQITPEKTTVSSSAQTPPDAEVSERLPPTDPESPAVRNHTTGEGGSGTLGPEWHVAADTLLVAVAACAAVLLSCCCSALLLVSWRGQRKRTGRYRTSWRGKAGSMRLIKYVLVREEEKK